MLVRLVLVALWVSEARALSSSVVEARTALKQAFLLQSTRQPAILEDRAVVQDRRAVMVSAAMAAFIQVAAVDASGGATAGGAYLLRAKERYNDRVVAGAKAFLAAAPAIQAGDAKALAGLFEKDGPYDDLCAAGFLLANAFRINSTQNPDKIPQVQKFKAFKAAADPIPAALKKKKVNADAYALASDALQAFLDSVGLKA